MDFAGFVVREWEKEGTIGMILTIGVVTSVRNHVQGWHCRGRPETGGGRHQVLGGVGGRGYLQD